MAKEITLEELAGSVSNNSQSTNRVTSNPKNAGNPVSIEEISETLKKNNNIQDTVTEETPLIQNAFDGMYSTINERVETFEKDYMPKILENAEDMALAEEMGIDTSTVQLTDEMITAARPDGYGEENDHVSFLQAGVSAGVPGQHRRERRCKAGGRGEGFCPVL